MAKKIYFKVYDFMTDELDLNGNELNVYAVIYSFSHKKGSKYYGSAAYIAHRANISLREAKYCIASLKKKGMLNVVKKNATHCEYYAIPPEEIQNNNSAKFAPIKKGKNSAKIAPFNQKINSANPAPVNTNDNSAGFAPTIVQGLHPISAKFAPNKENIEKDTIIDSLGCLTEKKSNIPTLEEVREYVAEHNLKIDPDKYFDKNEERGWITKTGDPVRCWKKHIRYWERTEREEKNYQNAMMHTTYDYDQIERDLMKN